ncbi:unnamed protein product [Onchocerca ochengi]|uniref:Uncharacterized protein n=1 Tax=Onchocerca ochengi TaxID=42157 RepID=A0A182E5M0_ONCOC|nr:unnamed protein product [Onchocerca ochengi]
MNFNLRTVALPPIWPSGPNAQLSQGSIREALISYTLSMSNTARPQSKSGILSIKVPLVCNMTPLPLAIISRRSTKADGNCGT